VFPQHDPAELPTEVESERFARVTERARRVLGLTVLAHRDRERIGERAILPGLTAGTPWTLGRLEPRFAPPGSGTLRALEDPGLSRRPLRFDSGSRPGNVRISKNESPIDLEVEGVGGDGPWELSAATLERGAVLLLAKRLALLLSWLDPLADSTAPDFGLVGASAAMSALRRQIASAAELATPVLVRGPTGAGKELVARAIHQGSRRARGPFVAVDLGALPATLAAAELFGTVRGAFTGADRPRQGLFRRAHGGTLFLDEIGEATPEIQVLLLRALEEREVRPLGADDPVRVDVRIVAATDADLEAAAAAGRFRMPLYHRLAGSEIQVPPLSARREDLGRLLCHILEREAPEEPASLPAPIVARLAMADWPGNVRELQNAARRLMAAGRTGGEVAQWAELERLFRRPAPVPIEASRHKRLSARDLSEEEIQAALTACGGKILPASQLLGVARASLYDRLRQLKLGPFRAGTMP
jgi:two-component system nitrogen regulation response regulator GlnG